MSIKKILYLIKDNRTNDYYYQVVGKRWFPVEVGQYLALEVALPDNPEGEDVLCKVIAIKGNVIEVEIVKEVI